MRCSPLLPSILATIVLAACGGGGGGSSPVPPTVPSDGAPGSGAQNDDHPCDSTYYDTILGLYEGEIVFDDTAVGGSFCTFRTRIALAGRDSGFDSCDLTAEIVGEVEQSVVPPIESGSATQCIEPDTTIDLDDDLAGNANPQQGVDYELPIRLGVISNNDNPSGGPYFGEAGTTVRYIDLFDTPFPAVRNLLFDGDAIEIDAQQQAAGATLIGRLERMSDEE